MSAELWQSLQLTLELAFVTTAMLLLFGLPLAHFLNSCRWRGVWFLEALVTLPIVLPPTVIGFYLLVVFAPQSPLGSLWVSVFGHTLAFSFSGLVVGSVLYSLPFAVQPFQAALRTVPRDCREAAKVDGAGQIGTFWHVTLPLASRGIAVGATLSFAHTFGEFGVVMMLGGNIPGSTKVASIALYDQVQQLHYDIAHGFAMVLVAVSFSCVAVIALLQRRSGSQLHD